MKSGFVKRILAMGMMVMLLSGDVLPVMADTVSGGDATFVEQSSSDDAQNENTDVNVDSEEKETTENNESKEIIEPVDDIADKTDATTDTVSGGDETGDSVSAGDLVEIEDEDVPLSDSAIVTLEPVTVDGVTIIVSGPASAFDEGTTVSAVAVEPAEVVIEAAEENEKATVKKYKAFDINLVCNGKFVQPLNGEQITVNFEGDMLIPDVDNNEDVAVYHVDENDNLTKMDAGVVDAKDSVEAVTEDTVEMTTTHFSTYVIVVTGKEDTKYTVTIEHRLADKKDERLFVDSVYEEVGNGDTISNFSKGEDFYEATDVKIVEGTGTVSETAEGEYQVEVDGNKDNEVKVVVYYEELKGTMRNEAAMIDYVNGAADNARSINYYGNYGYTKQQYEYMLNNQTAYNRGFIETYRRFNWTNTMNNWFMENWKTAKADDAYALRNGMVLSTMGAHAQYQLHVPVYVDANNNPVKNNNGVAVIVDANDYNRQIEWTWDAGNIAFKREDYHIVKGLLNGVKDNDGDGVYEEVDFAFPDPGFFTSEPKAGKTILDGYSLEFERTGVTHILRNVYDGNNNLVFAGTGMNEEFFPLNSINNGNKNEYFGMRYDFDFSIIDYVGDMTYKFSGDDDLYVCMDGNVILDLGGVHDPYPGDEKLSLDYAPSSVDIWTVLLNKTNYTEQDKIDYVNAHKDEKHTITVLFMERGGSKSNCYMEFAMPNIQPSTAVITKAAKGDLTLTKVDSTDSTVVLSGAEFKLTKYTDAQRTTIDASFAQQGSMTVTTAADGVIKFVNLRKGYYVLTETKAPFGYEESAETWYVTAAEKQNTNGTLSIEFTVTTSTGASIANNQIKNVKMDLIPDAKKSATLVNWDKRIYKIDLKASAKFNKDVEGNVSGVIITDEISEYFELCDKDGNKLTALNGATITTTNGKQVITWNNQTVPVGDNKDLTLTIYVRAKDDFAGGNYVPTNGSYTVEIPGEDPVSDDTPYVNVKCEIEAGEENDKIFLGEDLQSYFTKDKQITVSGVTFNEDGTLSKVKSANGKEYTNFDYVNVTLTWMDASGNEISVDDILKSKPESTTVYTSVLSVSPKYESDSDKAQGAATAMKNNDGKLYTVSELTANGTYTVEVVSGQIKVTKKIMKDEIQFTDGDPIFTFVATNQDTGRAYTNMVRFTADIVNAQTADANGYIALTTTFDNLEKGNYVVKELDTLNYEYESSEVLTAGTNVDYVSGKEITFAIGRESVSKADTDLEATKGAALYINKVYNTPFADKDMLVNQVVIENGKVVIKKVVVPVQE